ncbi:MAG: hypothetical protein MJZ16_06790, partial [Bacteroidales bacterium]|nr:hypothetical protein [Bacteroidales bacterium]
NKIKINALRVYASMDDFIVFTPYDGFDPEASSASISVQQAGIDAGSFPSSKKVVFGLNVTF